MKKKIYNQPRMDVTALETGALLQGIISVSNGGTPPPGEAHAPRRGELIH